MSDKKQGIPTKKTKVQKDVEFIKFPYAVRKLFEEITRRQQNELNEHLVEIYAELKIKDRLNSAKETGEEFQLRPDFSGIDVLKPKVKKAHESKVNKKS